MTQYNTIQVRCRCSRLMIGKKAKKYEDGHLEIDMKCVCGVYNTLILRINEIQTPNNDSSTERKIIVTG